MENSKTSVFRGKTTQKTKQLRLLQASLRVYKELNLNLHFCIKLLNLPQCGGKEIPLNAQAIWNLADDNGLIKDELKTSLYQQNPFLTSTERSSSVMASRTLLQKGHASVENPLNHKYPKNDKYPKNKGTIVNSSWHAAKT